MNKLRINSELDKNCNAYTGSNNHITVGVYSSGDFKYNIVKDEHLKDHIAYNKLWRPGRAFFVDGVCVNKGYLKDDDIEVWTKKISEMNFDTSKPTIPYR